MQNKQTEKNGARGKPGPGRPKGSVNKTTGLLKDAILLAADKAGGKGGMVGYLHKQAQENPTAFMTLLGKVLPTQVNTKVDVTDPLKQLFAEIADSGRRIGS